MIRIFSVLLAILIVFSSVSCKKDSKRKVKKNHRLEVGASAHDFLSSDDYEKLVVEIQYMEGFKPTDNAVNNLVAFLNARLNKAVSISYSQISAQGKSAYSLDDIQKIEDDNRKQFTAKKQIAAYFLFLDGEYSGNSGDGKVLGIAYYNTSMVIFQKTILDNSGGFGQPSTDKIENTVLNHEFGHILGLVSLGSAMQTNHIDADHGNHCSNQNCLMYWEAETGDLLLNMLGNSPVPALDANCLSDLKANGGK